MMKRLFVFLCAFIISISFMCQSSLTVYASGILTEEDEDALEDGLEFAVDIINEFWLSVPKIENAMRLMFGQIGLFLSQDKWSEGRLYDMYCEYLTEKAIIENSETYDDYLKAHIKVNANENEITSVEADSEIMNTLYDFSVDVIENECGWYEWNTYIPSDLIKYFNNKCQYDYLVELCKNLSANEVVLCRPYVYDYGADSSGAQNLQYSLFSVCAYDGMVDCRYDEPYYGAFLYLNWEYIPERPLLSMHPSGIENGFSQNLTTQNSGFLYESGTANGSGSWFIVTNNRQTHRIFKTLEEYKMYSVGERPYYATSDFYNYDSSQDNSVTLTGSDLSNGSVYGDVYNYIINNYDNPDGLTEDELRDILDDYFNNSGGGSGSSGNGSGSGSSGNGLMDFLGGLGSIGDAILSILGKLMEYIGKALDLIGGTVTKVIDIIPKNITALLGALFPFFPEEWLTAIELGLVLAVIVGIVGLFKK